jgi:DNA-binding protein YbaB
VKEDHSEMIMQALNDALDRIEKHKRTLTVKSIEEAGKPQKAEEIEGIGC